MDIHSIWHLVFVLISGFILQLVLNIVSGVILQNTSKLIRKSFLWGLFLIVLLVSVWVLDAESLGTISILIMASLAGFGAGMKMQPGQDLDGHSFDYVFGGRISLYNQKSISKLVIFLAILSVGMGVAVMEISMSVVYGFKDDIQMKVVGFGSHIQVGNYLANFDTEINPIEISPDFELKIEEIPGVRSISPYLTLPCMLKSPETLEGVVYKGVSSEYDWDFFKEKLVRGRLPNLSPQKESKEILISEKLSNLLMVDTSSSLRAYFFRDKPKSRNLKICGIYKSGMEEFDAVNIIGDILVLKRIMRWDSLDIGGYEIKIENLDSLHQITAQVFDHLPMELGAIPIDEIYPEIFDWLDLQHQNVWAILVLMIFIAIVNMISVILILILERTQTIGLLKALGLSNFRIRRLFLVNAILLITIGIALGNVIGLGALFLQDNFGIIGLDQKSYFVEVVPVKWVWIKFFLINAGVLAICAFSTWFPTMIISKISPLKAIRFN